MFVTRDILSEEEVLNRKKRHLEVRLLGIRIGFSHQVVSARKVYVPYAKVSFKYQVSRKGPIGIGVFNKLGKVDIIVDLYNGDAFYLDLDTPLKLDTLSHGNGACPSCRRISVTHYYEAMLSFSA